MTDVIQYLYSIYIKTQLAIRDTSRLNHIMMTSLQPQYSELSVRSLNNSIHQRRTAC